MPLDPGVVRMGACGVRATPDGDEAREAPEPSPEEWMRGMIHRLVREVAGDRCVQWLTAELDSDLPIGKLSPRLLCGVMQEQVRNRC